jgi:excisionase family DNA binding protein
MTTSADIELLRVIPGTHCNSDFRHHYQCGHCAALLCPACWLRSKGDLLGTVRCTNCHGVNYFGTASPGHRRGIAFVPDKKNPALVEDWFLPDKLVLTPREVAKAFNVASRTVRRMLDNGIMSGFKVGRQWRITREEALTYFGRQAGRPHAEPKI